MHKQKLIACTLAACLSPALAVSIAEAQCAGLPNCQLAWADEFDGTTLDLSKWEHQTGNGCAINLCGWGNNELQIYSPGNTTVANGELTITAREESNGTFTSSRIRSLGRGDFTYGRFEMRAKLPEGQGMWPAFWMLSSNPSVYGTWAASGEIDIMESLGNEPERIYGTIHYGGSFPDNVFSGNETLLPAGSATDFHEYAVEWTASEIRWYLDGQLYSTRTSWWSSGGPFPAPFDIDFHLLLNLAVGGNFPGNPDGTTVFPQDYVIDYVRVYQTPPGGTPGATIVFDDMEHGNPIGNGWFTFDGNVGGTGIGPDSSDLPPVDGGAFSIWTGAGSGGASGFFGGFGRTSPQSLDGLIEFSFWINPDAGQDYRLEINLQEDDNSDGQITAGADDEFQYNCVISATGPCAISGGGWQKVTIPLSSFFDDNSFSNGGNGVLDATLSGNGQLINVVFAIIGQSGTDVSFRTDYWTFDGPADTDGDGVADSADNCIEAANPDQRDTDGDGYGNVCDADFNNDCVINAVDLGILKSVFFSSAPDADINGDGVVNVLDLGAMKVAFFSAPGPAAAGASCD